MKKILWFDTETTGLDPVKNDIIQLAGLIEIDGKMVEEFDFKCAPFSCENISQEALSIHGMTKEQILKFPMPEKIQCDFTELLAKHCDKFNKADKFYPAGFNVKFDIDFLAQWFKKCGDNYLGSWINWRALDPLPMLYMMDFKGELSLPNYKLETVAKHFGVDLFRVHDAISDVRATRLLMNLLMQRPEVVNVNSN
jgi:DNA polymerase III, epsilon subunit and related 3''-5'' exonucleases